MKNIVDGDISPDTMVIYHPMRTQNKTFVGTHLEKTVMVAFSAQAKKEGRSKRAHLRHLTIQALESAGLLKQAK